MTPAAATCPADGNGTNVTVEACSIELSSYEVEITGGPPITNDDLTLTKLAEDCIPPPGSGHPRGGT